MYKAWLMVQSECHLGLQIFSDVLDYTHVYVRSLQMSVEYIFSVKSNTAMNRTDIALGSQQIEALQKIVTSLLLAVSFYCLLDEANSHVGKVHRTRNRVWPSVNSPRTTEVLSPWGNECCQQPARKPWTRSYPSRAFRWDCRPSTDTLTAAMGDSMKQRTQQSCPQIPIPKKLRDDVYCFKLRSFGEIC